MTNYEHYCEKEELAKLIRRFGKIRAKAIDWYCTTKCTCSDTCDGTKQCCLETRDDLDLILEWLDAEYQTEGKES